MAVDEVLGKIVANDNVWETCKSGSALARVQKGIKVYLKVTHVFSGRVVRDDGTRMNGFSGLLVGM